MREAIIWIPLLMMKHAEKASTAPLTGLGISVNTTEAAGMKAIVSNSTPVGQATLRLATPVASTSPALPEPGLAPTTEPSPPPRKVVSPSLKRPRRADFISSRTQVASLTRCASAIVPMALTAEASAASANGIINRGSKDQPRWLRSGAATSGAPATCANASTATSPPAAEAA